MKRPVGPVSGWSEVQLARWIRDLVKSGMVQFAGHAIDRGGQRGISVQEMLDTVRLGRTSTRETVALYEAGQEFDEERLRFTHAFQSRRRQQIVVVAGLSDLNPNCVVVTCWTN